MKTFSKFIIFVSLFSAFQFSFFASLSADEKTTSLEEIVVTATKIEEPKKDVPASVQIITQEDIKNSTAKVVNLKGSYRPIKNLEITAYIERTRRLINEEREFLFNEFAGIEALRPYPSAANFLLVKILGNRMDSSILTDKLIEKGILIRDCSNFRNLNNRYIRVAVRSHKENLKLIRALEELLCKS